MAHGLSLELAEIKPPEWRPVDPAKMADVAKNRQLKKIVSKKARNQLWRRAQQLFQNLPNPETRGEFMVRVRKHFAESP